MTGPEKIKCTVTNWNYIYDLCRDLSASVVESGYEPDVIVALARGGWFAGRIVCDFLGISDLISLKVEHYVDDIADTGKSLQHSLDYVREFKPTDCKTGVLQLLFTSEITPDYYAEFLEDWMWVVYPWNFIEDMIDLIVKLMAKEKRDAWNEKSIKAGLNHSFSIDPIHFDIAQPGRLPEILNEMQRRKLIELKEGGWTLK
jgi:hypoxanthine phosphoribosyltransferase